MKKVLIIPFIFFCVSVYGQFTKPELYQGINTNIRLKGPSQTRLASMLDSIVVSMGSGGSMVYPGVGIPLSTGSAWGTSITDNSANWNDALRIGATQTNTTAKTFLDNTLLMRNVANTNSSRFTNTNTSARIYTLPNFTGSVFVGGGVNTVPSSTTFVTDAGSVNFEDAGDGSTHGVTEFNFGGGSGINFRSADPFVSANFAEFSMIGNSFSLYTKTNSGLQTSGLFFNNATTTYSDGKTTKNGIKYSASGYETDDLSLTSRGYVNSGTSTLTNKTINLASNTLTGTKAQFNAALSDDDFATLIGNETLSNKILGSGTWWSSAPTITDGLTITFNPNGTQAGFNFGSHASNPSVGNPGDGYYNSTANDVMLNDGNWRPAVLTDKVQTLTNKTISPTANTIRYPTRIQTGTSYTIQASDENYIIQFTSASAIAVTLPDGLSTNFNCTLMNYGGGVITVTAATTLNTAGSANTIETQYTGASFQHVGSNVWDGVGALGSGGGGGGISNTAANNELMKSDGTDAIPSGLYSISAGDFYLGNSGLAGSSRNIVADGSASNVELYFQPKGISPSIFKNGISAVNNAVTSSLIFNADEGAGHGITSVYNSSTSSGSFKIKGANGVASYTVTGQKAELLGGNAYTSGNNNGGDVNIEGGAGNGTGTKGVVTIGNEFVFNHTDKTFNIDVATSTPPTPAANTLSYFARKVGGRAMPAFISPSGLDTYIQSGLARNKIALASPNGNSTTITSWGIALTATGTATAANVATTNLHTQMKRLDYLVTTAATTAVAGFRSNAAQFWRGNAAGRGGWHMVCRWGPATGVATSTNRAYVGLGSASVPTDVQPSSQTNIAGMGWDAADTNIQFIHNDGSGTATKIDLGASFPVPTSDRTEVYEIAMFCAPNGSEIFYEVTNLATGDVATGSVTTDLIVNTTLVAPRGYMSVGGTSSVIGITLMSLYIETDY